MHNGLLIWTTNCEHLKRLKGSPMESKGVCQAVLRFDWIINGIGLLG
jgi:hypothetical protein